MWDCRRRVRSHASRCRQSRPMRTLASVCGNAGPVRARGRLRTGQGFDPSLSAWLTVVAPIRDGTSGQIEGPGRDERRLSRLSTKEQSGLVHRGGTEGGDPRGAGAPSYPRKSTPCVDPARTLPECGTEAGPPSRCALQRRLDEHRSIVYSRVTWTFLATIVHVGATSRPG